MTALEAVSAYLPPDAVPIDDIGARIGQTPRQLRLYKRFHGLSEVRYGPEQSLADLMVSAASGLTDLSGREHRVRYLVHARTLQTVAPYPANPLHEARRRLGLEHASAFTLTEHACASGLLAVDLIGRLLRADGDPDALGLLITGEKAFTPLVQHIPDTTYMGEGGAAVLLRAGDGGGDTLRSYVSRTRGEFAAGLWMDPESSSRFQEVYETTLAEVIAQALEEAGTGLEELRLILPHNVNRHSWRRLCKRMGYPAEQAFLDNVSWVGHCFCADPFINYRSAVDSGFLRSGDYYLMAAVGLGATFSAMVFQH
ncbi:3-oxoacyl-[acyl-carrier-protein] synthase III C-terminal domain-containing protein [Nocardiopsis sp. YSL2]|uniref:3-oxoacyl-[acyl-carrier-protein] synthase III C-terminal domain-containing protein n=1 Tax=Nocardiopsis sp. YSL2 TaxID=2939492 RepID=UPI0026F437A9|nr:3-oxoacyl-[acyl-carrier-protein] synthase III C-terminal domain-containing protein [Nocardiopsis sp. YSL2]